MPVTDPIADLLTRIRNAIKARKKNVDIPLSSMKKNVAEVLKNNNFINDYGIVEDNKQGILRIQLKYTNGVSAISGLKKISTPGLKVYIGKDNIPKVLNGLGMAVLSTPKGIITDKQARRESIGGEVICHIW
ncbi:MAG: 30S ribosomal protein S8 [Ignavibacteriales bacterium]|nr:30S ribosomal protein S8 [Ignavibacteriales bacterium]